MVNCTNFGIFLRIFLCNFPIDKFCEVWYNGKLDAWQTSTRRQIKKSEYFNSLHCATGFTQHSVGIHRAPLPMTFWRISLACGFYLGGLLIYLTSFLNLYINYNIDLDICQYFKKKLLTRRLTTLVLYTLFHRI